MPGRRRAPRPPPTYSNSARCVSTPIEQITETDIPGQVEEEVTIGQVRREGFVEVLRRDLQLPVLDAVEDRGGDLLSIVPALNDGHRGWFHVEVVQ